MISIRQISYREAWPIRGQVFQPNRAVKKNKLKGDAEAVHIGAYSNQQLIGVLTWHVAGELTKLRKLAVLEPWRRQGIASQLVSYCLGIVRDQGLQYCSLLATSDSLAFYQSIGFEIVNENVRRGDRHFIQMVLSLSPSLNR